MAMGIPAQGNQSDLATRLVSLLIISILGLQLWVSFLGHRKTITDRIPLLTRLYPANLWPFLPYPMFQRAHYPGDLVDRQTLYGILDDSTEVVIGSEDIPYWQLQVYIKSIATGDSERINELAQFWETRNQRRLKGLRLENHPLVFTGNGLEEGQRTAVSDIALPVPTELRSDD